MLNDDFIKWLSHHKGGVQGDSTVDATLLGATLWRLETLVHLKGKDHKETYGFLILNHS